MISLGIDCGTQSTKTIALDWESGEVLATAQEAYDFVPGLPAGAMEQNPQDWVSAAETTIGQVLAALGSRKNELRAIGVSGQQHGLVVLDAQDQVVRPAKLWCDVSTVAQCETLTRHCGGAEALVGLIGNTMRPGYTAPKILWLKEQEPENWRRTRSVLLPHDYLNFWLTGEKAMEYGDASGTALLDVRHRQWAGPVLEAIAEDLAEKLPRLQSSLQAAGHVRDELRHRWGLESPITVSAGGGDNMMAAIGTGNLSDGAVTASLGTSGTLFAFASRPLIDPQGEVAAFCDSSDHWLPLVCTMNVTLVTEHVRKMFQWSFAEMDAAITSVPAGSDGLLLLPYLTGERTPDLPQARGVLHGMTLETFTPAHLARAAMEGVTLGLGYGLQRLRELGLAPTEIRLTGGGSNSASWRQICADLFDVPAVCLESGEGAGLGAAIQAGWTAEGGKSGALADAGRRLVRVKETSRVHPDPASRDVSAALLERAGTLRKTLQTAELL